MVYGYKLHFTASSLAVTIIIKLALYGTNGRLFTTDVSVKFKVTWHKN